MGYGDELMALGEAESIYRATGARVLIVDRQGAPRWSPVWENHPAVARSADELHRTRLVNGPGCRPYIKEWTTADGAAMAVYSGWRSRDNLGHLVLSTAERDLGLELRAKTGPYVVIEPHVRGNASPNKDWGFERYQELVAKMPETRFVQLGADVRPLEGAVRVRTASFRDACGVLAQADAYVGPEGGLHHAAAALRRRAAVIFGSFISPETTGYSFHLNFFVGDQHAPCGRWAPCAACKAALERVLVADVVRGLRSVLAGNLGATADGGVYAR